MQSLSIVKEFLELVETITSCVSRYNERRDLVSENRERHACLLEKNENKLVELTENFEQLITIDQRPPVNNFIHSRLTELKSELLANKEKLDSLTDQVQNAGAFSPVRRTKLTLDKCENIIKDCDTFCTETLMPAIREEHNLSDEYTPDNNVPPNPPRLTLDYSTTETCEGRLKACILEGSTSGVVGVVASGLGGVGKTCAVRGLATDTDIRNQFSGGVLYIQLGNDAEISGIVNGIADSVRETGGEQLAKRIRGLPEVLEASKIARPWFRSHKCLFLVDDIWWVNGITSGTLRDLCRMMNDDSLLVYTTRDERFLRGAEKRVPFEEREVRGGVAQRMLLTHAGFDSETELDYSNRMAFQGILDKCGGLPLAIGIAGATVMEYCDQIQGTSKQDAWSIYYEKLQANEDHFLKGEAEGYGPLLSIVQRSLEALDNKTSDEKAFEKRFRGFCVFQKQQKVNGQVLQKLWNLTELSEAEEIAEKFRKVSLVQITRDKKSFFVQLHDLVLKIAVDKVSQRTTNEGSINEKRDWFQSLVKKYTPKEAGITGSPGTNMTERMKPSRREARGCLCLVRSLACICTCSNTNDAKQVSFGKKESNSFIPWWSVEDDGFIHDNICRLLEGAEETAQLAWLLERAQWVVLRLQRNGIGALQRDIGIGMRLLPRITDDQVEMRSYFKLVGSAARMSCASVVENAYEAWFQMYGRMLRHSKNSRRTREFLSEVKENAPRPWVEPSVGILNEAGSTLHESIEIEGSDKILCLSDGEDLMRILWRGMDGASHVTEYDKITGSRQTYTIGSVNIQNESTRVRRALIQNGTSSVSEKCVCGAFAGNLKGLVTGHDDGKVRLWDVGAGYKLRNCMDCPRTTTSIGINGDGSIIVYGSDHGRLYLWDTSIQDKTGNRIIGVQVDGQVHGIDVSYVGHRFVCFCRESGKGSLKVWDKDIDGFMVLALEMRDFDVDCVAISNDGKRVVGGSPDGELRIWNIDSADRSVELVRCNNIGVKHVALSADGRTIVVGSSSGNILFWDAEEGKMIGQPLHVEPTNNITVSGNGKEVITELLDTTVRVFRNDYSIFPLQPEKFHCTVSRASYCGLGSKVVTLSEDSFVRTWCTETGKLIGRGLKPLGGAGCCVALSENGSRIVTGSDTMILVFDANSGQHIARTNLPFERSSSYSVALNTDGARVMLRLECEVYVWDIGASLMTSVTSNADMFSTVAMSADGSRIAYVSQVANDFSVQDSGFSVIVWDVNMKETVGLPLRGHTKRITSVALSSNGKRLVSGSWDHTVRVWDVDIGKMIGDPFVHDRGISSVEWDAECSQVGSVDVRRCKRLWNVKNRECVVKNSIPHALHVCHGQLGHFPVLPAERRIAERVGDEKEKVLASPDREVIQVGEKFFSERHGSHFWPFCRILR